MYKILYMDNPDEHSVCSVRTMILRKLVKYSAAEQKNAECFVFLN